MKEDRDSEIDLLLRRLSRRDGTATHHAAADDGHLDADELSAYAQNAVPPAARARYIEHLVECATCRKLATELSLSLGAMTAIQVETVATPGWFKQFLASLFSPMVLRYAVPALGLIVVAVVGLVVLRQQQRQDSVAQMKPQPQPFISGNSQAEAPASETTPSGVNDAVTSPTASPADVPKAKTDSTEKPATKTPEAKPERGAVATDSVSAAQQVASADSTVTPVRPGVAVGGAGAAPAAAKAAPTETAIEKKAEEAPPAKAPQPATQSVEVRNEPEKDSDRVKIQREKENENVDQAKSTAVPLQSRNIAGLRSVPAKRSARDAKRAEEENDKADKAKDKSSDDADTRSIAGRRFRKERGIWVDTAYDSSTATVNMARGSEQFRALVADEPVIGNIAKQLEGELIVVWKGHAYHIR